MFGGCGHGTVCSHNSIKLECHNDGKTGLIGTCTPEIIDFSNVTFGNGTFRKCKYTSFSYTSVNSALTLLIELRKRD